MDRRIVIAALLLFVALAGFFLLFRGAGKACATNLDCQAGSSCVQGKCTTPTCKEKGEGCLNELDCCGLLECSGGTCSGSPGDHTAVVNVTENGYAYIYGAEVKVGKIIAEFGPACGLESASTEVEITYANETKKAELSQGGSVSAGGAKASVASISGKNPSGLCEAMDKSALIRVERSSNITQALSPGETALVPGTDLRIRLEKITPAYQDSYPWKNYELNKGGESRAPPRYPR